MTPAVEMIYFLFAFFGMLYTFNKVGITRISILFVLVFWEGLIDYLDTIYFTFLLSTYKIGIVLYAISLVWKKRNRFKNQVLHSF